MRVFLLLLCCLFLAVPADSSSEITVIYDGAASKVTGVPPEQKDLWLTLADLTRVSGFVLKPQGACLGELCIPVPKAREKAFLRQEAGKKWFNLSELARVLRQPEVEDLSHSIRLFGPRPEARMKTLETLEAPNFTLPDWKGTPRSLTGFRGKKVMLITWASW